MITEGQVNKGGLNRGPISRPPKGMPKGQAGSNGITRYNVGGRHVGLQTIFVALCVHNQSSSQPINFTLLFIDQRYQP